MKILVVGCGLAGLTVSRQLQMRQIEFKVIDAQPSNSSSKVAAGMWNPIGFKRLSKSWKIDELLPFAISFYQQFQKELNIEAVRQHQLVRFFTSLEEANRWQEKLDHPGFVEYLEDGPLEDIENTLDDLHANHGYGWVKNAGRLVISKLLSAFMEDLSGEGHFQKGSFGYEELVRKDQNWEYRGDIYSHVVFCEGHQMVNNPYFNYLPLVPNKGELLTVKIPNFQIKSVLNKGFFILPLGNDLFKIGATFNAHNKEESITEKGRVRLEEKLQSLYKGSYEIIDQHVGIRPTVPDRRPILGQHPNQENLFILNGLGSKGVVLAPFFSRQLVGFMVDKSPLWPEINCERYAHYLS